jgi:hypothetical protein
MTKEGMNYQDYNQGKPKENVAPSIAAEKVIGKIKKLNINSPDFKAYEHNIKVLYETTFTEDYDPLENNSIYNRLRQIPNFLEKYTEANYLIHGQMNLITKSRDKKSYVRMLHKKLTDIFVEKTIGSHKYGKLRQETKKRQNKL